MHKIFPNIGNLMFAGAVMAISGNFNYQLINGNTAVEITGSGMQTAWAASEPYSSLFMKLTVSD